MKIYIGIENGTDEDIEKVISQITNTINNDGAKFKLIRRENNMHTADIFTKNFHVSSLIECNIENK